MTTAQNHSAASPPWRPMAANSAFLEMREPGQRHRGPQARSMRRALRALGRPSSAQRSPMPSSSRRRVSSRGGMPVRAVPRSSSSALARCLAVVIPPSLKLARRPCLRDKALLALAPSLLLGMVDSIRNRLNRQALVLLYTYPHSSCTIVLSLCNLSSCLRAHHVASQLVCTIMEKFISHYNRVLYYILVCLDRREELNGQQAETVIGGTFVVSCVFWRDIY